MILKALHDLAEAENLIGDPDFEQKPVSWILSVLPNGVINENSFERQVLSEKQPPSKTGKARKPKETIPSILIPRQFVIETGGARTSGAYAYFLVDKAEYVFGFLPGSEPLKPQESAKIKGKQQLFLDRLEQCAQETKIPALAIVLQGLKKVSEEGLPCHLPEKMKANDLIALKLATDNHKCLHNYQEVKAYWKKLLTPEEDNTTSQHTCLVTGKSFSHVGLFPMIKKVPGGQTSGAGLVSFNAGAFESYGWSNAYNATISPIAAQKVSTALNRLIDHKFTTQDGRTLTPASEKIAKDTTIAYWGKCLQDVKDQEVNGDFLGLLNSQWKGQPPHPDDIEEFYAMTLSGAQGRVIIRDYFESTSRKVYLSLKFHWDSLQIEPLTPPSSKVGPIESFLYATRGLLLSTTFDGKQDGLPPNVIAQYYYAVLKGENYKLPVSLIHNALNRFRVDLYDDSWGAYLKRDRQTALIKSYLIRNENLTIEKHMNPKESEISYLLGRLLSCYNEMQRLANYPRKVNVGILQKSYAKFLANPLSTFPDLNVMYEHHLASALKNETHLGKTNVPVRGVATRLSKEIQKIYTGITTDDVKKIMSTTGMNSCNKALFTIGMQHQEHWNNLSNDRRKEILERQDIDPKDSTLLMSPLTEKKEETSISA